MKNKFRDLRYEIEQLPLGRCSWRIWEQAGDEIYDLAIGDCEDRKSAVKQARWAMRMIEKVVFFGPGVANTEKLAQWSKAEYKRNKNASR